MGIFDAINTAEQGMAVHRFRVEVAAQNLSNVHTRGWQRKEVDLRSTNFSRMLGTATGGGAAGSRPGQPNTHSHGAIDARHGAVEIAGVRAGEAVSAGNERQMAMLATSDMLQAKSAFELNVRATTLLKSMALSSLEIGRGN
jgi:flagellar basal body rod protein FlgC